MAAQQAQQSQFSALKPATWGSLKFAQAFKFLGARNSDDASRVTHTGKENEYAANSGPPKVDFAHLQSLGPRRQVAQRYALQPNLNVGLNRPPSTQLAPGLSGLLPPGSQPQQQQHLHLLHTQQHASQEQHQQRPSTPSSPTSRGRLPLGQQTANPNFVNCSITTRLPTPVRINAAAAGFTPSSSANQALPLLKPPSPSRSLSQGGAAPSNPFASASACSSPATSTATSTAFTLPVPPPVVPAALVAARASQQQQQRSAQAMPWASSATSSANSQQGQAQHQRHHTSSATSRPSAPVPERSILASVHPRNAAILAAPIAQHTTIAGAAAAAAAAAAPAAPAATAPLVSISSVPAFQAALQQALAAAAAVRKPDTFKDDNFASLFDSMMHPGVASKLDGPLPHELPDDVKYGEGWYKHCRDWNAKNKPAAPYVVPAAVETVPATPKAALQPQWSLDEAPMSEACCRALDIAHHGLRKVLTPAASSRSASTMAASMSRPAASSLLAQHSSLLDDTASSSNPAAAALSSALEALARDSSAAASSSTPQRHQGSSSGYSSRQPAAAPTSSLMASAAASSSTTPMSAALAARAIAASADAMALGTAICGTPERPSSAIAAAAAAALGIRTAAVMALVDGHETPVVPTAAKASLMEMLSPTPTRAGGAPPSNATTPGGPSTPGGAASTAAPSAAATPASAVRSSSATPTTGTRGGLLASPACEVSELAAAEALLASAASCSIGLDCSLATAAAASTAGAVTSFTDIDVALVPPRELSCGAALSAPEPAVVASQGEGDTALQPPSLPAVSAVWSPAFPPVEATAAVTSAAAPAGLARQYVPSPVTLMHGAPRDLPTPNPAFFSSTSAAAAGPSALVAAVTAFAAPQHATNVASAASLRDPAGPSTSTAPAATDPFTEIAVGIQRLTTLKHNILAEDREVDVASITQVIQLKLAVEQLLARTNTAQAANRVAAEAPLPAPTQMTTMAAVPLVDGADQQQQQQAALGTPPRKLSRSASFSAFIKGIFSPKAGSASKAAAPVAQAPPIGARAFGSSSSAANVAAAVAPASPAVLVLGSGAVGVQAARPASASALPRRAASPSVADRGRYAALHQRAAARLAEAATEPAAAQARPAVAAQQQQQRGDVWRRYEEKIATHRNQLDTTKTQLDDAVRKLNDMQTEFDELLLCLGMESAKNKALCDAMRAAGIDPEPILAAIEEQWLAGGGAE